MLKEFLEKESTKRIFFFAVIVLILYMMKSILNLLLLTFLFTYLISSLIEFVYKPILKVLPIRKVFISSGIYLLLVLLVGLAAYRYIPIIITQTTAIVDQFTDLTIAPGNVSIEKYIMPYLSKIDISAYTKSGVSTVFQFISNLGAWGINIFISLILSLFFILEKEVILKFLRKFKESKVSGLYNFVSMYGASFLNSFGKVIKTQVIIAIINSIVSVIFLAILGFPQLMALGAMVFILGLIPVAGVIISLVPLVVIAFKIGGLMKVIYVLLMIAGIHSLESYVLNPRLMSEQTKLPVFFTFVTLIIAEHFLGIWGLLLGVPLFIFILDLLGISLIEPKNGKMNGKHVGEKEGAIIEE